MRFGPLLIREPPLILFIILQVGRRRRIWAGSGLGGIPSSGPERLLISPWPSGRARGRLRARRGNLIILRVIIRIDRGGVIVIDRRGVVITQRRNVTIIRVPGHVRVGKPRIRNRLWTQLLRGPMTRGRCINVCIRWTTDGRRIRPSTAGPQRIQNVQLVIIIQIVTHLSSSRDVIRTRGGGQTRTGIPPRIAAWL